MVVNETRVIPARLFGRIERGEREIEILLLRESTPGDWACWVRPARRLQGRGRRSVSRGRRRWPLHGSARGHGRDPLRGRRRCAADRVRPRSASSLHQEGRTIRTTRDDYQTIYARVPGAVAAPTAGLHFTEELIQRIAGPGHRTRADSPARRAGDLPAGPRQRMFVSIGSRRSSTRFPADAA